MRPRQRLARTAGANYVAPIDPPVGGGEDASCTEEAPSQSSKNCSRREARITCRGRHWTITTTVTPPDGFAFGIGRPTTNHPIAWMSKTMRPGACCFVSGYHNPSEGSVVLGYN
jgi:hypothetical protein